jgi:hypothetical protein
MMKPSKAWWQRPGVRVAMGLVLMVLLGGAVGGVYLTQSVPEQPIAFPHSWHVSVLNIPCTYCHAGVEWGPTAGLPSTEKCWGCHQQVQKASPELEKLKLFVESGEPIPWVPVAIQPDFVQFDHQPHIQAGVACQSCHGDLSRMTVAEPQRFQNMGWCLDCHKKQAPENFTRLSDCATCHY